MTELALSDDHNNALHHVVVVGGGFAGIQCIKSLKHKSAKITLIDQQNHHLFQPLLYQVATTILPPSEIAWPLRQLFRDRKDVTTLMAKVTDVDKDKKLVTLDSGATVAYDTLVLATGARHSYFGNRHWEPSAPGLKTLDEALEIRRRILSAFENAEKAQTEEERKAYLTFAIVGAGPTGVELAGIVAELKQRILPKEFRHIDTREARVMLIEAGPKILPNLPDKLIKYAHRSLEKLGVEIHIGQRVTGCADDCVSVNGDSIPCKTIIWAAGVQASDAAIWLDADKDGSGRVLVEDDLTVPKHPEIFVVGDTASVKDAKGTNVPGIAPAAKQMGKYVAKYIATRLTSNTQPPQPFKYWHMGNLATLGRSTAVAAFGKFRVRGAFAWWLWGVAHIYFLIGARSRIAVAWNWSWSFITGQNSARLITKD